MTRRGLVLFAAMCVIWGIPYLLIKVAVSDLSPAMLVFARTAIAALLLLPIAVARNELRAILRHWAPVLAFAAIEIAIPWLLLGVAEQRISSSLTGLLIAAVPLVGAVIARTTGARERLGVQSGLGLVLGLVGVAAIVGLNLEGAGAAPLVALALVAICYAIGPVILQRYLAGVPALGVIAASLGVTAIVYLPIAAFSVPEEIPSATVVGSILGLAVVCTAIAFLLFFALIAEIGAMRATVITYVNPAVAAVLGVAILDEHFTVGMGVGFALVLAGSVLATRRSASAESTQRPSLEPAADSAS
ncbi:MAG: DMT family transporter [Actinobacteria bacterium]|nr:DMT family transporter [Actinomycetota bacterium]